MRPILLLTLALFTTACDDDPAGPADAAAGTYVLVSVNGEGLPYTLHPTPLLMQITEGSIQLNADGTFVERVTFRTEDTGTGQSSQETETHQGTWARSGAGLILSTTEQGLAYSDASLADDALSYTVTGVFGFDVTMERQE